MYIIRRVARTLPGKAWEVANYLTKITSAYEEAGRNPAQVYIGGQGVPGTSNVVYAEWMQESIEPTNMETVPDIVRTLNGEMQQLLSEYPIEFYELVTPEKLRSRGLSSVSYTHLTLPTNREV